MGLRGRIMAGEADRVYPGSGCEPLQHFRASDPHLVAVGGAAPSASGGTWEVIAHATVQDQDLCSGADQNGPSFAPGATADIDPPGRFSAAEIGDCEATMKRS